MKEIVILGSTGSIGKQTLDVVRSYPDRFSVKGLACGSRIDVLLEQIIEFRPDAIYVEDEGNSEIVKDRLLEFSKKFASEGDRPANHFTDKKELDNLQIYHGEKGLTDIASLSCDVTVNALVGINGLKPTIAAINRGNDIIQSRPAVRGGELPPGAHYETTLTGISSAIFCLLISFQVQLLRDKLQGQSLQNTPRDKQAQPPSFLPRHTQKAPLQAAGRWPADPPGAVRERDKTGLYRIPQNANAYVLFHLRDVSIRRSKSVPRHTFPAHRAAIPRTRLLDPTL